MKIMLIIKLCTRYAVWRHIKRQGEVYLFIAEITAVSFQGSGSPHGSLFSPQNE